MLFSLWGFVPFKMKPKDGTQPYVMRVWSLLKNNLTWSEAKKERKNFRHSEIVPRVFDVPELEKPK